MEQTTNPFHNTAPSTSFRISMLPTRRRFMTLFVGTFMGRSLRPFLWFLHQSNYYCVCKATTTLTLTIPSISSLLEDTSTGTRELTSSLRPFNVCFFFFFFSFLFLFFHQPHTVLPNFLRTQPKTQVHQQPCHCSVFLHYQCQDQELQCGCLERSGCDEAAQGHC